MPSRLHFLVLLLIASSTDAVNSGDVDFQVINNSPTTKGGVRFTHEVGLNYTRTRMAAASQFIWRNIFHQYKPCDRRAYQQVKLFINVFSAAKVAYTGSNEIYFSADYMEKCRGSLRRDFTGIMYREMTHVWQWNGGGQANPGLIDGIGNYVRMKAKLAPAAGRWAKPGCGDRWDQGSDVTARFLEYCDGLKKGFVADLNRMMKDSYSDEYFEQLLGKSVGEVWRQYKSKYNSRG